MQDNDRFTTLGRLEDLPQSYRDELTQLNLVPLWPSLRAVLPPHVPTRRTQATHWSYQKLRPLLLQAGELTPIEKAERRVLVLANPGHGLEKMQASAAMYLGMQLLLPGEWAPSHRHTQSALRFIVEGQGAYTAVDGERTTMHPGDFIITPSWTWHDHGCEGNEPVVWLDGLDIPMIRFLDAGFAENGSAASQIVTRAEGSSYAQYGHSMAPVRVDSQHGSPFGKTSPIFSYPYERSREALHKLEQSAAVDAWDGVKLRYINPLTGGSPMPTMATFMQRLRGRPLIVWTSESAADTVRAVRFADNVIANPPGLRP